MGLKNATITKISGAVVRTTHLTGVVTDFGLEGVQYLWRAWDKTYGGPPDAHHHAPDFQAWVERLPRQWRVVILAVSPMTSFDTEAVLDMTAALQKLRSGGRDLVVCGVRPVQYKVLNQAGFVDVLGIDNF